MSASTHAQGLSIGIIMDGNGRWAQQRGLPRTAGHKKGVEVFDEITRYADSQGVSAITFYAFSTENWSRPKAELNTIMELFGSGLKRIYKHSERNNKVVFLGDKSALKPEYQRQMLDIEEKTKDRTGMVLNIAINYGGRQEITRAARILASRVQQGELSPEQIDEDMIEQNLYTQGQPMPDFILRTSGEERISNFMLWQCAYSEFIFTSTYWPDFSPSHFDAAVQEFNKRTRRFGGV